MASRTRCPRAPPHAQVTMSQPVLTPSPAPQPVLRQVVQSAVPAVASTPTVVRTITPQVVQGGYSYPKLGGQRRAAVGCGGATPRLKARSPENHGEIPSNFYSSASYFWIIFGTCFPLHRPEAREPTGRSRPRKPDWNGGSEVPGSPGRFEPHKIWSKTNFLARAGKQFVLCIA